MSEKTKECPSCAMEIDADAQVCPICQYEFPKQSKVSVWVAVFLIILFLLYFIF
ncbi:zinc ribbon domain-containing protein [Roseivirga sp.]|uniref:zinc ribbon domain-containing protein n=1 Tax=Roseivirga sp. TaxID=1964215 RepID=UPI003B52E501